MQMQARGTRAQVMHGTAMRTSGGLTKKQLMYNKHGRIVSRRKHFSAKREQRLRKHGYGAQKGHFGPVRLGSKYRRTRTKRGGGSLAYGDVGLVTAGVTNHGNAIHDTTGVQFRAGNATM